MNKTNELINLIDKYAQWAKENSPIILGKTALNLVTNMLSLTNQINYLIQSAVKNSGKSWQENPEFLKVYNLGLAVTKFVVQTDKGYSITNVNEFIQQCQLFGESVINLGNDKSIGDALATNMLTKNTNFLNLLTTFKSTRLNT